MNSKRKLAVVSLVVMMMVTAVGYAYFSDSLLINGTANNAKFDVQFKEYANGLSAAYESENRLLEAAAMTMGWPGGPGGGGWPGGNNNPDVIDVKVTNLVPGESCSLTGTLINKGTVHAYNEDDDWLFLGAEPSNYKVDLVLPDVLDPNGGEGAFTLTVTMNSDIDDFDGVDTGDYEENFKIQFAYRQ